MKVNLLSLGCPKNLVDSEKILGTLSLFGISICALPEDSDIIIINTCGFIKPALEETEDEIKKALHLARVGNQEVYVFGCAVNRFGNQLRSKYPKISGWFNLEQRKELITTIATKPTTNEEPRLPTTQGYAYLKIAEGCSNCCSYCTIPSIKGEYRSSDMAALIKEATELSEIGTKEVILIAQDTTRYGYDRYEKPMLVPLIRSLSQIPEIQWIRILYAHPKSIDGDIITEIAKNDKVCKYVDLPIQHINDRILRMMNRSVTRKRIQSLIKQLKGIKGLSLRTTVIVGFPTETDDEFKELFTFLESAGFDWLGVFPYYCEQGTEAARMPQVPDHIIDERYHKILDLQQRLIQKRNAQEIGKVYKTLIHSQNGHYLGHTEFLTPEIDCQVITDIPSLKVGSFYDLRITRLEGCDLYAENAKNTE